ncbi:hypothetical protein [Oceanithermus sp.]
MSRPARLLLLLAANAAVAWALVANRGGHGFAWLPNLTALAALLLVGLAYLRR